MKDRQLAVVDQTTILGRIDRIHDLGKRIVQLLLQFRRQLVPIDLNQPFHGFSLPGNPCRQLPIMPLPESFGTPRRKYSPLAA
jgi:hypothetical protein